jgi:hypothetical protein
LFKFFVRSFLAHQRKKIRPSSCATKALTLTGQNDLDRLDTVPEGPKVEHEDGIRLDQDTGRTVLWPIL